METHATPRSGSHLAAFRPHCGGPREALPPRCGGDRWAIPHSWQPMARTGMAAAAASSVLPLCCMLHVACCKNIACCRLSLCNSGCCCDSADRPATARRRAHSAAARRRRHNPVGTSHLHDRCRVSWLPLSYPAAAWPMGIRSPFNPCGSESVAPSCPGNRPEGLRRQSAFAAHGRCANRFAVRRRRSAAPRQCAGQTCGVQATGLTNTE